MTGSTSADDARRGDRPDHPAQYYSSNEDAVAALKAGQIDAIVLDTPTAYVATVVPYIENSFVVGQLPAAGSRSVGPAAGEGLPPDGARQRGRRHASRRTARSPRSRRSGWRADGRHPAAEVTRSGNVVP
jgi:hypothetical protein